MVAIIKKNQTKYFKNDVLKSKVGEIEDFYAEHAGITFEDDDDKRHHILRKKDGKSLSNAVSPVTKKTYERPIDSQQIFHQTEIDIEDHSNKVKIDSFLVSILEATQNTNKLEQTIAAIHQFFDS